MSSISPSLPWRVSVNVEIEPPQLDAASCRLAERFGLVDPPRRVLYEDVSLSVAPGQIVAVLGPSGAGKSVLLEQLAAAVPGARRLGRLSRTDATRPAAACLRGGDEAARLGLLSRCGLAEATALITPAGQLSGGQQFRLLLARVLHEALRTNRPTLVLADEFGSTLDRITATVLCRQIRKLISASPVGLVLATPRPELLPALRPDVVFVKPLGGPLRRVAARAAGSTDLPDPRFWPIRRGRLADYHALGAYHYLAGPPAAHKRVYVVRTPPRWRAEGGPDVAAVLVVSPPVPAVRGRNVATAGRYAVQPRRVALSRLNADLECISRVIVHPMFRGCGLAVRLVRHALADSPMPAVEALAAMGKIHPFFRRAGMTLVGLFRGPSQYYHYYLARTGWEESH